MSHHVIERIAATGEWISLSALHTGGDAPFEQNADMSLARNANGQFYIPGPSIAGAARGHLARILAATRQDFDKRMEPAALEALFGRMAGTVRGDARNRLPNYASLLRVDEARLRKSSGAYIRDNVRIDAGTGTASNEGKFNLEVLPAGASFEIGFTLSIYDELPHGVKRDDLLDCFRWVLECFRAEGLRLGARTRQGMGQGEVRDWNIRRYDMRAKTHVFDWLHTHGTDGGEKLEIASLGAGARISRSAPGIAIDAAFRVRTSLLIRAGGEEGGSPDVVHLRENGKPLLSGTSFRGAFRHRCEAIARTLWGEPGVKKVVTQMFGEAGTKANDKPFAGRIRFTESVLKDGDALVQSRVAIDRFTGASRDTALFDEAPFWPSKSPGEHFRVRIELEEADPVSRQEIVVLLGAFKDLWTGDLTLGGEEGIGRGVCRGVSATITRPNCPDVTLDAKGRVTGWNEAWQKDFEGGLHE